MNYQALRGDLEMLSAHLQSSEWSANSLLNLSKPTQENLLKYSKVSKNIASGGLILQAFALLPRIAFRICAALLLSILTPLEWWRSSRKQNSKFDWLVVSNTSNLRSPNAVDSVMAPFATLIETKIAFLYLNAELTSRRCKKRFPDFETRNNLFICPKTENPLNTLKQLAQNILALSDAILLLTKNTHVTLQQKCILMNIVLAQFSRQTMRNLLIGKEVSRISRELDISSLIYSYEGNAHELSILSHLKLNSIPVQVFPYQHAPIVTSQFGLHREMQMFNDKTIILTSGSITKDYFQTLQKNSGLRLKILEAGSYKFNRETLNLQNVPQGNKECILFLPEADKASFYESLKIMKNLALDYEHLIFVIRKHPSLKLRKSLKKKISLNLPTNCSLSSLSLNEDFDRSQVCVFRSSAAAIEAARFGVYPVHIDLRGDFDVNPFDISFFEKGIQKATNYVDLKEMIGHTISKSQVNPKEYIDSLRNFAEDYFTNPMNSEFQKYLIKRR